MDFSRKRTFNNNFKNYTPPKESKPRVYQHHGGFFKASRFSKVKHDKITEYSPTEGSYSLNDLLSYSPLGIEDIKGPLSERPIISELSNYLCSSYFPFIPLSNLSSAGNMYNGHEIDLLVDSLVLPLGIIIPVRYEAKLCNSHFNSIKRWREQLSSAIGLYPVTVEWMSTMKPDAEERIMAGRFSELRNDLGDLIVGSLIRGCSGFDYSLNLGALKPAFEVAKILSYNFRNVIERDLILTAYSLFSNLGFFSSPLRDLSFNDGILSSASGKVSFSTYPLFSKGNNLLVYKSLEQGFVSYNSIINDSASESLVNYEPLMDDESDSVVFLDPCSAGKNIIRRVLVNYHLCKFDALSGKVLINYK